MQSVDFANFRQNPYISVVACMSDATMLERGTALFVLKLQPSLQSRES